MGKRQPSHSRVKTQRNYTVEEIARLFDIHKSTVRRWVKAGLIPIDQKRPMLIHGLDLFAFLKKRKAKQKQKCKPGEFFCVRCRVPRKPSGGIADYSAITEKFGNLIAICPACDAIMNRGVNLSKIGSVCGDIEITFPEDIQRVIDSIHLSVNSDLR